MAYAREKFKIEILHLEVYEGNPAKHLYERRDLKSSGSISASSRKRGSISIKFSCRRIYEIFPVWSFFQARQNPSQKEKGAGPKLSTQGELYDLQQIYNEINAEYFKNKLELKITWFGSARRRARRHRKLGLYSFQHRCQNPPAPRPAPFSPLLYLLCGVS